MTTHVNTQFFRRLFLSLTGVLLGLAVVLVFLRFGPSPAPGDPESYFLPDPLPAPAFTLRAHTGGELVSTDVGLKHLVVFFGYTHCPDVCPLTLSNLSRAFREMGGPASRFQVLLITVDPARDTPQRLSQYLANFNDAFLGLTGSEEEIRSVANGFGAYFARTGEGNDYTVDHTARVFVVSPSGKIPLTFPVTATPDEMIRDLTLLLETAS